MKILEITQNLAELGDALSREDFVAMLNMPAANFCEKRSELVGLPDGTTRQACNGCVTQSITAGSSLSEEEIKEAIDWFAENYQTRFITINGRGDPLHPRVIRQTFSKIEYGRARGMQGYIFTAGDNLDYYICNLLADNETNVMISLFGNLFIDADFFEGREYPSAKGRMQNQTRIAGNLRTLIGVYRESSLQSQQGTTRLGMNYVVSETDIQDNCSRVKRLKEAANREDIFFVCNTDFRPHHDAYIQEQFQAASREYTDFNISHSTGVNGQCQMGAGSSVTVDYDGELYRCPYMSSGGDGNFMKLSDARRHEVTRGYLRNRPYACTLRQTPLRVVG